MAKFLNTSATNYFLEELIKEAHERLVIISPFLKFNDRMKELLADKNRMKLDVRLVYGKSELAPQEINWLGLLEFVRTSFCQNLHAKCYLNERAAIITSMNLYEFSQVNNNEMGVHIEREKDPELYREAYEEAQRLIRISEQVRLTAEKLEEAPAAPAKAAPPAVKPPAKTAAASRTPAKAPAKTDGKPRAGYDKLTTSKLAAAQGLTTSVLTTKLVAAGLLQRNGDRTELTEAGRQAGGEERQSPKYGPYVLWPKTLKVK